MPSIQFRNWRFESAKYAAVQVAGYGLDILVFSLSLRYLSSRPSVAYIIAKIIASIFAYLSHSNFTFRPHKPRNRINLSQAMSYFLLVAINVPLASVVLYALLLIVSSPYIAKILTDGVFFLVNYWVTRSFVFKN